MRHKSSWTDCFPLEIYWTWILAGLIAGGLVLVSECSPTPAHAGFYLDAAGGLTHFLITANDGDYVQRGLPHQFDVRSLAYRVGLGYRVNEQWAIQAGYVNLGTLNQTAQFVADEDYRHKANWCIRNCQTAPTHKITDAYHGGELTVTRSWIMKDYGFFLKGGGAYLMHRFTIVRINDGGLGQHYGQFPAVVAGIGASYKWAYVEMDYYHGLGGSNGFLGHDQGWPLSKEILVTWFGVQIPIGG